MKFYCFHVVGFDIQDMKLPAPVPVIYPAPEPPVSSLSLLSEKRAASVK